MIKETTYLNTIQNEYFNILTSKKDIVLSTDLNLIKITKIIEEIDIFWRKNRDKVLFDLDYFRDKETIFLAGSMYLDLDENKHYYFKTFSQEHIINDPILKFQNLTNTECDNAFDIISLFKRSFNNTLNLLENYSLYFYILPLDYIISEYEEELIKLQNTIFYQLLSSLLDLEISSPNSFIEEFDSINEIESILDRKNIELFTFDEEDKTLSLKQKLNKYENDIPYKYENELMKFLCLLYKDWNQIIRILLTFFELGFIPYISFERTFLNFPRLFLSLYQENDAYEILNKIIIFYTFNHFIDKNKFDIDFEDYVKLLSEYDFENKLIENNEDIILKNELNTLYNTINKEFNKLLE